MLVLALPSINISHFGAHFAHKYVVFASTDIPVGARLGISGPNFRLNPAPEIPVSRVTPRNVVASYGPIPLANMPFYKPRVYYQTADWGSSTLISEYTVSEARGLPADSGLGIIDSHLSLKPLTNTSN